MGKCGGRSPGPSVGLFHMGKCGGRSPGPSVGLFHMGKCGGRSPGQSVALFHMGTSSFPNSYLLSSRTQTRPNLTYSSLTFLYQFFFKIPYKTLGKIL
jgi:hypothetical protein